MEMQAEVTLRLELETGEILTFTPGTRSGSGGLELPLMEVANSVDMNREIRFIMLDQPAAADCFDAVYNFRVEWGVGNGEEGTETFNSLSEALCAFGKLVGKVME